MQSGAILVAPGLFPTFFDEILVPLGHQNEHFLLKGHHFGKNGAAEHHFGKWCPFVRGHYFVLVPLRHQNIALLGKKALFSKMVPQGHWFSTIFFSALPRSLMAVPLSIFEYITIDELIASN